jgi:DNA polymerase III epsilon subunit-like protein
MKALIFDTETNGLPKDFRAPMRDLKNWPRVIQLGWTLFDLKTGETLAEHVFLIKPQGWKVPKEKFWIDNGFSQEKNEREGAPMVQVLGMFVLHAGNSDVIVAHNMDFDYNVLGAEMLRYKQTTGRIIPQLCTMKAGTEICKIPGKYGKYKWPSLDELHRFLFKKNFEGAHDAGADVQACKVCLVEMINRKLIQLPGLKSV